MAGGPGPSFFAAKSTAAASCARKAKAATTAKPAKPELFYAERDEAEGIRRRILADEAPGTRPLMDTSGAV